MSNETLMLSAVEAAELRECLELLHSVSSIEYHNKNWLPNWATRNERELAQEKLNLIERAINVIGTSSERVHT